MDDLISRQQAISRAVEFRMFDRPVKMVAVSELEALPSAQPETNCSEFPNNWIPCSERLPDKKDDYFCSYIGCAIADICEYDPDRNEWGFYYDYGWKVVSNVIAWMPLPEPYTESGREE